MATSDHFHYEELAALEAGGFLSDAERVELFEHTKVCPDCLKAQQEFSELARSGLPLTLDPVRESQEKLKTRPDSGLRSRFVDRARAEGILFSEDAEKLSRRPSRPFGLSVAAASAFAAAIIAVTLYGIYQRPTSREALQAQQQVDQLKLENTALRANLSQLNQTLATGQGEIENLRAQLGIAAAAAENLRRNTELARGEAERSSSRNAQLLDEARNQEQMLAQARDEAARVSQLHVNDEASLVQQELRIADLSNKLRIASATLDMERQLVAAGQDIRELMAARQLHIIDVHDTDPNGNTRAAFGRVFLTEGKSLTFYAFDLNQDRVFSANQAFQVWAVAKDGNSSSHSLGFLRADAKAQGRWVLKVDNPALLQEVNSVFVTVEPGAGGKQPSGQKMLYAYLGTANHP